MGSFYFKRFSVRQTQSVMKINTDGVLLPAWLSLPPESFFLNLSKRNAQYRVLDIGTGTGVIALIIAQRLEESLSELGKQTADIHAIDIDPLSVEEATLNFANSPWSNILTAECVSLQRYNGGKFSLIVSNPPFFSRSLIAPEQRRAEARHNHVLPFDVLIESVCSMLEEDGLFAVVLPYGQSDSFKKLAGERGLSLSRLCRVKTVEDKPEKRVIMEFVKKTKVSLIEETLIMQHQSGDSYTNDYCNLVEKYYLKDFKRVNG